MEWSDDKIKGLITVYNEKRILWDLTNSEYKNNKLIAKVWEELSKTFDCSVKDVKDKVKNLRTTFHRIRKKQSGSATEPEWKFYSSLSFLLEVDLPRKGLSSQAEDTSDADDPEEFDQVSEAFGSPTNIGHQDENSLSARENTQRMIPLSNASTESHRFVPPQVSKSSRKSKRRSDVNDTRADEAYEILKRCTERNEFFIYGEYVANELRKLSTMSQNIVKHRINNILFEASMGSFDNSATLNTNSNTIPVPSPSPAFSWSSTTGSSSSIPQPENLPLRREMCSSSPITTDTECAHNSNSFFLEFMNL